MRRLDAFQRWAVVTTLATYALIAIGGLVRAAGAGLGCPDWPRCFGQWVPPTRVADLPPGFDPSQFNVWKTWTEYVNRGIGVLVGFLILGTLVLAVRHHRGTPRVLWPTVAAFLAVLFEGWLGGMVVRSGLSPWMLSAHLAGALVTVGLLQYATVCAFFEGGRPLAGLPPWRRRLGLWAAVASALVLAQVALGALVRGQIQLAGQGGLERADWLASTGLAYGVHRAFAVLVVIGVVGGAWRALDHARAPWLRRALGATIAFAVLQPVTGLLLHRLGVPPFAQVLHLWLGALLLGALLAVGLLAFRTRPESGEADDRSGVVVATA